MRDVWGTKAARDCTCRAAVATMEKAGHRCKAPDRMLGTFGTLEECARAVRASGGWWFVYGWDRRCWQQETTLGCPEGWHANERFDFYRVEPQCPEVCSNAAECGNLERSLTFGRVVNGRCTQYCNYGYCEAAPQSSCPAADVDCAVDCTTCAGLPPPGAAGTVVDVEKNWLEGTLETLNPLIGTMDDDYPYQCKSARTRGT